MRKATPEEFKTMGPGLQVTYLSGKPVYKMLKTHEVEGERRIPCVYGEGQFFEQALVATFPAGTFDELRRGEASPVAGEW